MKTGASVLGGFVGIALGWVVLVIGPSARSHCSE